MAGIAFDQLASSYDKLWTLSPAGRHQRDAVWRVLDPLVRPGDLMLDLGCGTGEDALHFLSCGLHVHAIDASAEMIRIARSKGVDAQHLAVESIQKLRGGYDFALSNFGVFNCIRELECTAVALAELICPGGWFALCTIGCSCLWEVCHFARHGNFRKAFRRWHAGGVRSSLGVDVYYPTIHQLAHSFRRNFRLVRWLAVGLCVPPSYVSCLSAATVEKLAHLDRRLAPCPVLRALADHRLLLFRRI
jgi:SAM-dependent methyltransferase